MDELSYTLATKNTQSTLLSNLLVEVPSIDSEYFRKVSFRHASIIQYAKEKGAFTLEE